MAKASLHRDCSTFVRQNIQPQSKAHNDGNLRIGKSKVGNYGSKWIQFEESIQRKHHMIILTGPLYQTTAAGAEVVCTVHTPLLRYRLAENKDPGQAECFFKVLLQPHQNHSQEPRWRIQDVRLFPHGTPGVEYAGTQIQFHLDHLLDMTHIES